MRRLGWIEAVVGTLATICGFAGDFPPLVAIGLALVGTGLWNFCRPSVTGLIVDGAAMVLAGIFTSLTWLWVEGERPSSAAKWTIAGLVQIVWGIRRLALYFTARHTVNDARAIDQLETMIRDLSKADAKADPTIAEFRTGRFRGRRNRLGLYDTGAIALLEQQAVRLEKRTDIWIEARGSTSLGRSIKVEIQMSDLKLTGRMSPAHFERFERWKLGVAQPRPIAA